MLNVEKELDGGTRLKISPMPSKGTAAGYNFGNLVHEASASIALGGLSTRLFVGQIPDWSGYEYIASTQNKLITHNLLWDFSAANLYTGAGLLEVHGSHTWRLEFPGSVKLWAAEIDPIQRLQRRAPELVGLVVAGVVQGHPTAGNHRPLRLPPQRRKRRRRVRVDLRRQLLRPGRGTSQLPGWIQWFRLRHGIQRGRLAGGRCGARNQSGRLVAGGEYRYDRSTGRVFKTSDDEYRRDNHVVGVSTVVSF
jgi:hypothetical protein